MFIKKKTYLAMQELIKSGDEYYIELMKKYLKLREEKGQCKIGNWCKNCKFGTIEQITTTSDGHTSKVYKCGKVNCPDFQNKYLTIN